MRGKVFPVFIHDKKGEKIQAHEARGKNNNILGREKERQRQREREKVCVCVWKKKIGIEKFI